MAHHRIDYSCPHFDAAIDAIEEARKINHKLRENADEFASERDELKYENERLEDRITALESQIKDLQDELNHYMELQE